MTASCSQRDTRRYLLVVHRDRIGQSGHCDDHYLWMVWPFSSVVTPRTRESIEAWISKARPAMNAYLFPSRFHGSLHLSTRQYARLVESWVSDIGLDTSLYGTHSLRRTKASLIYRQTKNLRAIQLLLGHAKLESTVRYLGIEIDDALEMAEQTEA